MNKENMIQEKNRKEIYIYDTQYLFWFIYLFFSIYEGYISSTIGSVTRYFLIVWIGFLALNILKKKSIYINEYILLIISWLFYYYFSLLWSNTISEALIYIGAITTMVVLYVLLLQFKYDSELIGFIISAYKWLSVSLAVLAIFYSIPIAQETRKVLVIFDSYIDPNNQVALMSIGAALCLYSLQTKNRMKFFVNIIGLFISVYSILQTGSRSGVLILLSIVLIWILFESKENDKSNNIIKRIILTIILLGVTMFFMYSYLPESTIERITGTGNLKFTDGTNREIMWAQGITIFLENIFFGSGWGTYESHNTFLTFLIDGGIIGILPLLIIIISITWKSLRTKNTLALLILLTGLIPSFFIGSQNKRFFWNSIILSTIILISNIRESEIETDAFS